MKIVNGDMWKIDAWPVIPTNTIVKNNGEAVMGAGVARQAAIKYPQLPRLLGKHIERFGDKLYFNNDVICLPTKTDWRLPSDLALIEKGCLDLIYVSAMIDDTRPIVLPQLGCGLGGLNWDLEVRPILDLILKDDKFIVVVNA